MKKLLPAGFFLWQENHSHYQPATGPGRGLLAPGASTNSEKADGVIVTGVLDVSLEEAAGVVIETQSAEEKADSSTCWCG